jgi:predicted nuclease of predicted toxin-antitoxin system
VRFLVDAQLPPALAQTLRSAGHLAEHVYEIGMKDASDVSVWDYAFKSEAAILTKDEDFVDMFRRRASGPPIIWLRIGNSSTRALLAWLMPLFPAVLDRLEAGDLLIEIR